MLRFIIGLFLMQIYHASYRSYVMGTFAMVVSVIMVVAMVVVAMVVSVIMVVAMVVVAMLAVAMIVLKGHPNEKIHVFFWFDSVENIK